MKSLNPSSGWRRVSLKLQRTSAAVAFIIILLGLGNIVYGSSKQREYRDLVMQAERSVSSPAKNAFPLSDPTLPLDRATHNLQRMQRLLDYYSFVREAGGYLVMIGSVLLLGLLVAPWTPVKSEIEL